VRLEELYQTQYYQSCLPKIRLERQYAKEHESEMDVPKILAWETSIVDDLDSEA